MRNSVFAPLVLGLLLGAIGLPVLAAEDQCKDAATTAAMRVCENSRYEKADRELNTVYAQLVKKLDRGRQEKLRLAQSAWLGFRDANANFLASAAEGGTLAPVIRITAMADMTEARAQELQKQLTP